jgi:hypothetical protein
LPCRGGGGGGGGRGGVGGGGGGGRRRSKPDDSLHLHVVEIACVAWHASFQPLQQEKTCNSAHEQTPLSTVDSILRHRNVGRAKYLSAPLVNGYGIISGVKRLGPGVDYPPPSSAEVNEKQNYTSTPPLDVSGLFWDELHIFLSYIGHWSQTTDGQLLAPETPAKVNCKRLNQQQYHINVFIHVPWKQMDRFLWNAGTHPPSYMTSHSIISILHKFKTNDTLSFRIHSHSSPSQPWYL